MDLNEEPFLELVFAACWRFQDLMDSSYRMEDPPNGKHVSLAVPLFVLPASLLLLYMGMVYYSHRWKSIRGEPWLL
jgi:hypothetical protein